MRSYAFTVISHIVGIVLSTGLLFYCVHEEIIFCPTFCGIAILYFSIHLYFIQMRQLKSWRYVVDCLRQQDLIQIVRSPYEDKVMRELADDLSAALRSLRGRLMDEEVRRQYFESLLNKVDTAVLVNDKEGAIEWKNRTADALLDTRCRLPNEFLEAIKAGKTVVRYGKPSVPQDWAIDATRIDLRGCERWIVSLKNIHSTLERNEMEAWQILIRVLTHEIMNSTDVGIPQNTMVLGKHSGKHALREKLESMGYELSDEELESVFTRFKDLADKKKSITSSDIEALVLHRQAAVQGSCQLVSHVVNTGHGVPNISCSKLQRGGEQIEDVAIGTGPLDASFKAINRMLQMDVKLESFSLNAVTDGEDAIGEAVVKVSGPDGRSYTGSGLSTDIIESSIRAYVNGINKIMESGN